MNRCILVLLLVAVTSCHEIFSYSAGGVDATADDLANSDLGDDLASDDANDGDLGLDTLTDCEPPRGDHILATQGFEPSEPEWSSSGNAGAVYTTNHIAAHCGRFGSYLGCQNACTCFIDHELEPPIQTESLYIRAYFLLPDVQTSDKMILLQAIGLDGERLSVGISGGSFTLFNDSTAALQPSTFATDYDPWFCLELGIVVDETAGSLTLWYNEDPMVVMNDVPTRKDATSGIRKVQLGLDMPQDSTLRKLVYFDDVVVSTQRIYCQD